MQIMAQQQPSGHDGEHTTPYTQPQQTHKSSTWIQDLNKPNRIKMTIDRRYLRQFMKGKLTNEMVKIPHVEVNELKMNEEKKEYWDWVKDGEDEKDEATGDQVDQDPLADCCVGDGVGDGGCGNLWNTYSSNYHRR